MSPYDRVFHLGGERYEDFMRSNLWGNQITQTDMLYAVYSEISTQTLEIIAGKDELVREFGKGFDLTNKTLESGFNKIADGLSKTLSAIEDLCADFNYNIALAIEQMEIQNKLLTNVIKKLDAIHKTLESPLTTQARELYRIALERLQRA